MKMCVKERPAIAAVVRRLFKDQRVQKVVLHYLAEGRSLPVPGMLPNEDSPVELTPIGAWSQYAEPDQGWQPTIDTMRALMLAMAMEGE